MFMGFIHASATPNCYTRAMKQMPKHTRLQCRNGTYYHRAKVPTDIAGTYGKREELISLRTKNVVEALRLIKIVAVEVDEKFVAHRREQQLLNPPSTDVVEYEDLSPETLAGIEKELVSKLLKRDDGERWGGFAKKPLERKFPAYGRREVIEADLRGEKLLETALVQMEFASYQDLLDLKKQVSTGIFDKEPLPHSERGNSTVSHLESFVYEQKKKAGTNVTADALAILRRYNIQIDRDTDTYRQLLNVVARAKITAIKAIQNRNEGNHVDTPTAKPVVISDTENPKLSKALDRWLEANQHISKNQTDKKLTWFRQFIRAFGDKRIGEYMMQDAREYVDTLDCLPSRYDTIAAYKRLNIVDAAKKAKQEGLSPTSADYANKKIEALRALWKFLMVEYDDTVQKNIFMDRKITRDKKTFGEEGFKAVSFTSVELKTMFNAPIFTGMKRKSLPYTEGAVVLRDERYWIPLLLLFHGCRPNEICQLYKDDIRTHKSILFMRLTESHPDQRIKNKPSHRCVPVHSELLKCGFKGFVDAAPDRRLFSALKVQQSTGRYSDSFAKGFGRFLVRSGIKDPAIKGKHVPYSFRHAWKDASRVAHDDENKRMDAFATRRLFGHVVEAGEGDTYGTHYDERRVPALKRELDKISYPGLDLSHLYIS